MSAFENVRNAGVELTPAPFHGVPLKWWKVSVREADYTSMCTFTLNECFGSASAIYHESRNWTSNLRSSTIRASLAYRLIQPVSIRRGTQSRIKESRRMRCSLTSAVCSLASRLRCNIRDAYSLDYSCFCIASPPPHY
jgi:hypothetical protein